MPEKRKPLIDDSEPQKEHSLEDDFNELIRRELGSPEAKGPDIKIEPADVKPPRGDLRVEPAKKVDVITPKEVPKDVPKEAPVPQPVSKPVKVEPKPVVKLVPKPVVPVVKSAPKPVKKETVKVKPVSKPVKVEPKPVKREQVRPKPVPKQVVKQQPKKVERSVANVDADELHLGRWVALAVVLLIAAVAVFAVGAYRSGKDSSALACATSYADERGVSLSWADANAVEQYWLKKAFEARAPSESVEILHMLACADAFVSSVTDPASYADCKTPTTYVVVDAQALSDNPVARLDPDSVLAKLNAESQLKEFSLAYKLSEPNVRAWKVVE